MKGKKVDNDYVVSFIKTCAEDGMTSTAQICSWAEELIERINMQIKLAEEAKKERCKLLDVISALGKTIKNKSRDKELLKQYEKIHEQK